MDREQLKLYVSSFINWMKSGMAKKDTLYKKVEELQKNFNALVVSYEDEIEKLQSDNESLEQDVNDLVNRVQELEDAAAL